MKIKRKTSVIFAISIVWLSSMLSGLTVSAENAGTSFSSVVNENHIIEDVPYVSQEDQPYCQFASLAMLVRYYVKNVTLKDILFNTGVGYSSAYFRPLKLQIFPGTAVAQLSLKDTGLFLGDLYGLSYESWRAKVTGDRWEQYWSELKEKITQDIPVITEVDPLALPWYKEHFNLPKGAHSGHSIVIVGFNETAGSIYYNDPGPTVFGEDEQNCTYVPLSIDTFQDALKNHTIPPGISAPTYKIETFEKTSNPMSKEEIFEKAHNKNIQRMKGRYFEIAYRVVPFTDYGVNGIKAMKRDLGIGIRHQFATMLLMKIFKNVKFNDSQDNLETSFQLYFLAVEKQNISQYLLEKQDLSPLCAYEGALLAEEAKHWKNLSTLNNELFQAAYNRFFKTIIESRPIIEQMKKELDEIIAIEQAIISGPSED